MHGELHFIHANTHSRQTFIWVARFTSPVGAGSMSLSSQRHDRRNHSVIVTACERGPEVYNRTRKRHTLLILRKQTSKLQVIFASRSYHMRYQHFPQLTHGSSKECLT